MMENQNVEQVESMEDIKSTITPEEYELFELEKMRYNNNSFSYNMGLLGVVCSIIAMFIALNSLDPYMNGHGYLTVLKILMNIVILLFGFLTCEKVKVYNIKYSYLMYIFAGVSVLRIFWYPVLVIKYWAQFTGMIKDGGNTSTAYNVAVQSYKQKLGLSMIGKWNNATQKVNSTGYLTANGYVRGIVLIIFLGCAAACFALSAYNGVKKSKRLHNYLESKKN